MKCKLFLVSSLLLALGSSAMAEEEFEPTKEPRKLVKAEDDVIVDRSERANPYANTPSYAQGGDTSRYSTSQGWSRGVNSYWWGSGRSQSDIPTAGYTRPSR